MKKLLLLFSLLIGALMTATAATPYKYLEFKTTDNNSITVGMEGLEITVANGILSLSNTSGQKMNIDAATLLSMQFTDNPAALNDITVDSAIQVEVYKLDGTAVGTFANASDAINTLPPGVYILKSTEGKTVKIMIEK